MEFRNAQFNANGTIDCEIKDKEFGWIPFTANQFDTHSIGHEIFEAARNVASAYVPPSPEQALARERENMVASAMQVRLALLGAGRLAEVEAIVAAADTTTQIAWDKAVEFRRNSPTIAALAPIADPPFSADDLDTLFRAAAQIEA